MTQQSIEAYDVSRRVESYDRDMGLMHPNRSKMVQVALEVLPFGQPSPIRAIDLGVGTGFFTERFLKIFPNSEVVAIDGAQTMIELAKARLGSLSARVRFLVGDFRNLPELVGSAGSFDVVFSAFALHHINKRDKETLLRQAVSLLRPGGWFVNADIIVADAADVEERLQQLRVAGIVERARGADDRFIDAESTRRFLDEMQTAEGDQPLTMTEDLAVLRHSGLRNVAAFWLEYRELVSGGQR